MKFDTNFIEKLADIINTKGLSEVSVKDGEVAVTVKKAVSVVESLPVPHKETVISAKSEESEEIKQSGHPIVSPMVGTFYSSSASDSAPFVEIGSVVNDGDVVCVIEAMKLMNEIKSDCSGKITKICVNNGEPVEYGQVLMYIE